MKLDGPAGPLLRVVAGYEHSLAVVTGVFPPERAPALRSVLQAEVDAAQPLIREGLEKMVREWSDRIIYGDPCAPEPIGILRGESPLKQFGFRVR